MSKMLGLLGLLALLVSCHPFASFLGGFKNIDLEKEYGISLKYNNVPKGMRQTPLIIDFGDLLREMSNGEVGVDAINTYIMGDYENLEYSNLINPNSKFKDSWFGVYLIFDDAEGRGRKFMLGSESARPDQAELIRPDALVAVPMLDQKLITYSTHQNQVDYTYEDHDQNFYFKTIVQNDGVLMDSFQNKWRYVEGEFSTTAALTDTNKTNMELFSSIRAVAGLPTTEVHSLVDPWHEIIIKGKVISKYFQGSKSSFWAIVYFNGSAFYTKDGHFVDNWADTDIKAQFESMFKTLEISCK